MEIIIQPAADEAECIRWANVAAIQRIRSSISKISYPSLDRCFLR
jgi:hypothetical protein